MAHAVFLGLHVTLLLFLKRLLTLKVTEFLPISLLLVIFFPVDGPKKGGSCDVSSWDAFYLALFWALNSAAWFLFNFH